MRNVSLRFLAVSLAVICCFSPSLASEKAVPVRHIVIFKYTSDASEEQIQKVTDEFLSLRKKIPGITGFETGVNNSSLGKNYGFTHVYLMTFRDEAARDAYLPHPEHEKFREFLRNSPIFEESFVVDWVPHE